MGGMVLETSRKPQVKELPLGAFVFSVGVSRASVPFRTWSWLDYVYIRHRYFIRPRTTRLEISSINPQLYKKETFNLEVAAHLHH